MTLQRTLRLTALATLMAATALSAQAQSKRDIIAKLPSVQKPEMEALAAGMAQAPVRQLLGQAQPILVQAVPADKQKGAAEQIDAEVKKYMDSAVPVVRASASKLAVPAYAEVMEAKFTEEELKQLVTMLDSPLIKRYQESLPEIQRGLLEKITADARPAVDPKLKTLQDNVAKILDTASGGQLSGGKQPAAAPAKPKK